MDKKKIESIKYLIAGGGLTGLCAGYKLQKDYLILEKEEEPGGLCRSINIDGFIFDYAIHILYTQNKLASNLLKNNFLKGNLKTGISRESWIYSKGVYTEYPFQANTYGLPEDVIKECLLGAYRANKAGRKKFANFAEWIIGTFGKGIAENFMLPYNRKQWGFPPEKMGYWWIGPRVPSPDLEEIIEGALTPPAKKFGPNSEFWYPMKGGIGSLPNAIFNKLDKNKVSLNTELTGIDTKNRVVKYKGGGRIKYEKLIYTLPLFILPKLIKDLPEKVRSACNSLEYNTIYAVNLGIKSKKIVSPWHWIYFPEKEFIFHRISLMMNLMPGLAPDGCSSITAEISESKHKRIDKSSVIKETIKGLKKAGILNNSDKIYCKNCLKLSPAYVIYDLNHKKNVKTIHMYLKKNNIIPAGRFAEWEYLNMDHSILSGIAAAKDAIRK